MKNTLIIAIALSSGWLAHASIVLDAVEPSGGTLINQNILSMATISGVTEPINNLRLSLNISGVPTGNLYAYLGHAKDLYHINDSDNVLVVLLNRVGRTAANPSGYQDVGLNVIFEQNALDVHQYNPSGNPLSGPLTGTWDVDGRNISPFTVTTANNRTTLLSSFIVDSSGVPKDPNGLWYLYVENLGVGGTDGKLVSWGMEMNYSAVPEPGTWLSGFACIALFGLSLLHRGARS